MPPFKPNPPLARATTEALQIFVAQWPRAQSFAPWHRSAEDRDALISSWAHALLGVTLDAIADSARRWLGDPNHIIANNRIVIPAPATFAKYARAVDRQHFRAPMPAGPKPAILPGRAHDLGVRAYRVLHSWPAVGTVNEELLKLAPDADAERRIREHRIGTKPTDPWPRLEHFDEAVQIVKARMERREAEDALQRRVS